MSGSDIGFRWLDILEKEFDRACVELDTLILDVEDEGAVREHLATMSACFSQLSHKALTVFQNAAKLEAELIDLRSSLAEARTSQQRSETSRASETSLRSDNSSVEAAIYARENQALRQTVLAQHSELCSARLAARYLEKELAGRIQQLQLLGRDVKQDVKERLWTQLEAEITLQRQKTMVKRAQTTSELDKLFSCTDHEDPGSIIPAPRAVRVARQPHQGLGIAITGGAEHGVPIIISSVEEGGPAWNTRALHAGDAILSVDDVDLREVPHALAANALAASRPDCTLLVTRHYVDSGWYPLMPPNDNCYRSIGLSNHISNENNCEHNRTEEHQMNNMKLEEKIIENDETDYIIERNGIDETSKDEFDNNMTERHNVRRSSPPTPTHKPNMTEENSKKTVRQIGRVMRQTSDNTFERIDNKAKRTRCQSTDNRFVNGDTDNKVTDEKSIVEDRVNQSDAVDDSIRKSDDKAAVGDRVRKSSEKSDTSVDVNAHIPLTVHAHLINGDPDYGTPV